MKNTRLKQILSGLLTFALLLTYPSTAILAYAASTYYINFKDADDLVNTIIVEEGNINTTAAIPPGHNFHTTQPFKISEENGTPNKEGLFTITGAQGAYNIEAHRGAAQGLGASAVGIDPNLNLARTYVLKPNLTATISDGVGSAEIKNPPRYDPADPDTPIPVPDSTIGVKVTSNNQLSITGRSEFKFKVIAHESEGGNPSFGPATDMIGNFVDYDGNGGKLTTDYIRTGNNRVLKIAFAGISNSPTFTLEFALPAGQNLLAGSEFSVLYDMVEVNSLILSIATPKYAVETVGSGIRNNPTTQGTPDGFPKTGTKDAFINLNKGDALTSVTSNFTLLRTVSSFNEKLESPRISIDWKWVPDQTGYEDVLTVQQGGTQRLLPVTVNPRKEDVTGTLVAIPSYKLRSLFGSQETVDGTPVQTRVTILGTGIPPRLDALTKTVGSLDGKGETDIKLVNPKFSNPERMDLYKYNNTADPPEDTDITKRLPFALSGSLIFGEGRGRAEKMVISVVPGGTAPEGVKVFLDNNALPYTFGTDIPNKSTVAGNTPVKFVANQRGQVTLLIDFYYFDLDGKLVKSDSPIRQSFIIEDTSPRDYAELADVAITSPELEALGNNNQDIAAAYPRGRINYGFTSGQFLYDQIAVPNKAANLVVSPQIPGGKGIKGQVSYAVSGNPFTGNTGILDFDANGGKTSIEIPMILESPRTITLTVTAENGREQQYIIPVNRMPPETDSDLKSLSVYDIAGKNQLNNFLPGQKSYDITVPYSTRWVRPEAITNSIWATVSYNPELVPNPDRPGDKSWIKLTYPGDPLKNGIYAGPATTTQKVKVQAENPATAFSSTYTLNITRKDPSTNNQAATLVVKDAKGKEIAWEDNAVFDKARKNYKIRIPYSNEALTVEVKPDDKVATEVKVDLANTGKPGIQPYEGIELPLVFELPVPVAAPTEKVFTFTVSVMSEKGEYTQVPYTVEVTRNDPDQDSALSSLVLQDQNQAVLPNFSFNPQTTDYTITVPFRVDTVLTLPVTRSPLAKAYVNKQEITTQSPSHALPLKAGETKQIQVEIRPEDRAAEPRYYNITVTRAMPSTDARLKSLVVNGGEEFQPLFAADKTAYSVTIPEGTQSLTFTAVPVVEFSTITVNGLATGNGTPSAPYEPLEATSKVEIVVTAEDGKTTMTYTVTVTDRNRIPKGTAADLKSLTVNYGSMSPRFKPNITEYDVALKDDTSSVDLLPVPVDERATFKVFAGTKQLGDYRDTYSSIVRDGVNEFSVVVTPENGGPSKTYLLHIYRKDEEQQGIYKPIVADQVDYEQPGDIVVDISKYPIVSAEVLNTLRNEYPDKTMIFQGNDYTLSIKGKDLKKLIPHEEVFDFSLRFTSPNEDEIWDFILEDSRNNKIEPVFVHFNHHGVLPAPMLLTLSLGREYRNLSATWNYYNEERDRIDYYGGLRTNSRGTFSVVLNHMSTYIFSDDRIVGAEVKSGSSDPGDLTSGIGSSGDKTNPNTGR